MNTKNLSENLRKQVEEILMKEMEEKISTLYCPDHGQFAQVKQIYIGSNDLEQIRFEFAFCCENLHSKILEVWRHNA